MSKVRDNPAVTIIIPAYNHERYVRQAIESILGQTFSDWQLIIIDDGSTDSTVAIINEYAKPPKVQVYYQENQGLSATLNRGMDLAKGRYFGFLPSDDAYYSEKLDVQADWLDKMPHIAAFATLQTLIDGEGNSLRDLDMESWFNYIPQDRNDFIQSLFERNFVAAPSVLVRTEILRKLGGFETQCVFMQDYEFWFRLLKGHEMAVLPKALLYYRWHGDNQTFQATPASENERAMVLQKAAVLLDPEDIFPVLRNDRRPEIIIRCRTDLQTRLQRYPTTNAQEIEKIFNEKFGCLLHDTHDVSSKTLPAPSALPPFDMSGHSLNILIEVASLDTGGMEQVVYDLAIGFTRLQHRVIVACVERGGYIANRLIRSGKVVVELLPEVAKQDAYREILHRYEIDAVNSHYSIFGSRLAAEAGIPVISVIHNIYSWLPRDVLGAFRIAEPFVSCYIAVSDDVAVFLQRHLNVSSEKIRVIPNGLDIASWAQKIGNSTLSREDIGFTPDDYIFLSVSSITRSKGQDRIAKVFPELLKTCSRARAVFLGAANDQPFFRYLKKLIADNSLDDIIHVAEFGADTAPYYSLANAFVLPSVIEGWSVAMMEAMYFKLPLIMTDIAGVKTVMKHKNVGILIPPPYDDIDNLDQSGLERFSMTENDPSLPFLLQAMRDFCSSPDKWRAFGAKGRQLVSSKFSLENTVASYDELIRSVVAKARFTLSRRCGNIEKTLITVGQMTATLADYSRLTGLLKNAEELNKQLTNQLQETKSINRQLTEQVQELRNRVDEFLHSTSWQITKPLRTIRESFPATSYNAKRSVCLLRTGGVRALGAVALRRFKRNHKNLSGVTSQFSQNMPFEKCRALTDMEVVIFAIVPFDDIGGGQRSAQLARVLTERGMRVTYVHAYPKLDVNTGQAIESVVHFPLINHFSVDHLDAQEFFAPFAKDTIVIFEAPTPKFHDYLEEARAHGLHTVFDLIDEWNSSLGAAWFDQEIYEAFISRSEIAVGSAKGLVNSLKIAGRDDALYIPNAADEKIFDRYKQYTRPPDLRTSKARKCLYFGSLYGDWFDWDCIKAGAYKNPNIEFYLIGEKPQPPALPGNVLFLSPKQIGELPAYLAYCDAALLPFALGKISDAVSPIKIFEYLFMGVPVVATNLPEVKGLPNVYIAHTPDEFAHLCATVTKADDQVTDYFIAENSWRRRADMLVPASGSNNVSVIILIHNNRGIIGRCLKTLLMHGKDYFKEVIVVDNASADGGYEYVRDTFPEVTIVRNSVNGCSSGRNLGVSVSSGKYLAFFDSDQWFTSRCFFEEAIGILEKDPGVGAIGCSAGWIEKERKDLGGVIVDYLPARGTNSDVYLHGHRTDIGYLATSGMFLSREVFNKTDGFDTNYDPTCFEDTDLSFQIKALGYKIAYRDLGGIRHQPHQTTKSGSDSHQALFRKNAKYMRNKWATHPDYFLDYDPDAV